MNGYQLQIDAFKQILQTDRKDIDRNYIKAEIKALEPFAKRTEEERIQMFNSGAFNDVLKSYCRVAMNNCNVDEKLIHNVLREINCLLDEVRVSEIIKK